MDFLDVTFNLATETFFPKLKDKLHYINAKSNHCPIITIELPDMTNNCLPCLSCNEEEFQKLDHHLKMPSNKFGLNWK